jgi:glycosyltransferase involved in cell wall biosynthesis
MNSEPPLVSVLLPVFEPDPVWIEECVHSVVNQTFPNLELVVVDDGSPVFNSRLFSWAEDSLTKVSVVHQENKGFTKATNEAYRTSDGSFVAPIGQDDKWQSTKVERQIEAAHRGFDVVFANVIKVDKNGKRIGEVNFPDGSSYKSIVRHCFPIYESSLISKAVLSGNTLLDSSFQVAGDWDLWLRIWKRSSITHVDAPLTYKRFHSNKETSRNYDQAVRESEKMIRRIARREPFDEDVVMKKFYRSKVKTLRKYGFRKVASKMALKYASKKVKVDVKKIIHKIRDPKSLYDFLGQMLSD